MGTRVVEGLFEISDELVGFTPSGVCFVLFSLVIGQ